MRGVFGAVAAAYSEGSLEASVSDRGGIAIIGMACRMPGAPDLAALWRLLHDGVEAIGEPPAGRFGGGARGGFIPEVDMFDAGFFGISPKEASASDPQQRLALEVELGVSRKCRRCR